MRFKVFLLQAVQSFSPFASSVLHDMGYQTQVVFNELVAGLHVSLGHARQIFALLLRLQGPGKGSCGTGKAK